MSGKRILATFVPEAWIRDHAVEVDGREKFDATEKILAMSAEERERLRDNTHASDDLAPEELRTRHSGPFRVEVEVAMAAYFLDMDDGPEDSRR